MNKKGIAGMAVVIMLFMATVTVQGVCKFSVDDKGNIKKIGINDQTKKNAKIIWCKMQNKGEAYCNAL